MKVAKHAPIGFTEIITSDEPAQPSGSPKKKPYLIFKMPYKGKPSDKYCKKLIKLGLIHYDNNEITITITSASNVLHAIKIFSTFPEWNMSENKDLITSLSESKEKCELIQKKKEKKIPLKSKLFTLFEADNTLSLQKTRNPTSVVRKKSSTTRYIFKKNVYGRSISEIESFNGSCFRLLLGERHPKTRSVHNEKGERIGSLSKEIPGFEKFHDRVARLRRHLTKKELLESELIKVWVAAYTEEDTDLHTNNYGFDASGKCVKIDPDRVTWPLTSKYNSIDPNKGGGAYTTPPITDFTVTSDDISSFPKLNNANPYFWYDRKEINKDFDTNTLRALFKDKIFIKDKYHMFLKRILIPKEVYEAIGIATLSSDNMRKKFVDHKINKTEALKRILLDDPGFQDYMIEYPDDIHSILAEFTKYNETDCKKDKNKSLRVDISKIKDNFNLIMQEIPSRKEQSIQRLEQKWKESAQKQREMMLLKAQSQVKTVQPESPLIDIDYQKPAKKTHIYLGHNCAFLVDENGTLYARGKKTQIGLTSNQDANHFQKINLEDNAKVVSVASGERFNIILLDDGSVYSTGDNMYGQLGLGDEDDRLQFTKIDLKNSDGTAIAERVIAVAARFEYSMLLLDDGRVLTCGNNNDYVLGLGDYSNRSSFEEINNVRKNVTAIAAGHKHSMLLLKNGSVMLSGKIDTNLTVDTFQLSTFPPPGIKAKAIAAGIDFSLLLLENGTAWICHHLENDSQFDQIILPVEHRVKAIAAGDDHSMLLLEDGSVWTAGKNDYGQLGIGRIDDPETDVKFTKIDLPEGRYATDIHAGHLTSAVTLDDQQILAFGYNGGKSNHLGLPNPDQGNKYHRPTPIIYYPTSITSDEAQFEKFMAHRPKA